MKQLRQIINDIKVLSPEPSKELEHLLWPYICYSPKMPLRFAQEQLLQGAEKVSLKVKDEYFAKKELIFNTFKWGNGTHKLLLTHGWGSKAADFNELIVALTPIGDIQIIAFDAPGNGSFEGELSNLLLFKQAVKAIVLHYGKPHVVIGHSLGAMANIIALREMQITPSLLISLTPLVRLKENFEASMDVLNLSQASKTAFLESFNTKFGVPASHFTLDNWYEFDIQLNHWLFYNSNDAVSPYSYLKEFLANHQFIKVKSYDGVGHDRTIKSPIIIADLIEILNSALTLTN
jgi:hypothetical protein